MAYSINVTIDEIQLESAAVELLKKDYEWLDLSGEERKHFQTVLMYYMTAEEYESWYEDTH